MNPLGKEIAQIRERLQLRQVEVANRSGLSPSVISRLEAGDIANPTAETLEKLAKALEIDPSHLIRVASPDTRKNRVSSSLRIGFTHSIWSAPFIPLTRGKGDQVIPGIEFASYGRNGPLEPIWLPSQARADERRDREDIPPPCPPEDRDDTCARSPYTAVDMLHLVAREQIDAVTAASQSIRALNHIIPCLQIAHEFNGCILLSIKRKRSVRGDGGTKFTLEQLFDTTVPATPGVLNVAMYYPYYTIAGPYAELILKHKTYRGGQISYAPHTLNLGDWSSIQSELFKGVFESMTNEGTASTQDGDRQSPDLVLVLAWEPHVSWILRILKDKYPKGEFVVSEHQIGVLLANENIRSPELVARHPDAQEDQNSTGKAPFVTVPSFGFDLLFYSESVVWQDFVNGPKWDYLLGWLKWNVERIQSASSPDDPIVEEIAKYFRMDEVRCFRALKGCGFSLRFHEKFLDYMKDLGSKT